MRHWLCWQYSVCGVHNLCDLVLVGLDSVSMPVLFYSDSDISENFN